MTDEEILAHFESLGDNCEFGLVQRSAGIEKLGFFRFNFAPLPSLLRVLDENFAGVDDPGQVEIFTERSNELMVRITDYRFEYHTHVQHGAVDPERLRRQQIKVIRFLSEKLLSDLRAAEKIFVRKGHDSLTLASMQTLLAALHRHGPATLLWVVPQDEAHPAGTVEVVAAHFLRGYIDRFALYDAADRWSPVWFQICRAALKLWREQSTPGTVMPPERMLPRPNLICYAEDFGGHDWWHAPHAKSQPADDTPRYRKQASVLKHRLSAATTYENAPIHGYEASNGLVAGSLYVASMFVWLPADFSGTEVGAVVNGFASVRIFNADLEKRCCWQMIWVSARVPPGVSNANPSLQILGPAGATVYSTDWWLELGVGPARQVARHRPSCPTLTRRPPQTTQSL